MASNYITAVRTSTGDKQIDYEALANKPKKFTSIDVNGTKIVSDAEFDTLSFTTGDGISLTPDVENKTINIDISDSLAGTMGETVSSMLVSDEVKTLYELEDNATLDDILTFLRHTITTRLLNVYVQTAGGISLENVALSGDIVDTNGNKVTMYTNENGHVVSRIGDDATSISVTATYSGEWQDVKTTKTITYTPSDKMIQTLIINMDHNETKTVSTSSSFKLSPEVLSVDISTAGGGGGGGAGASYVHATTDDEGDACHSINITAGGGGGGGGYVANETATLEEKENVIEVIIGAGGSGGVAKNVVDTTCIGGNGAQGNSSYVLIDGITYSMATGGYGGNGGIAYSSSGRGGTGGSGNGTGGTGSVGYDGGSAGTKGENATATLGNTGTAVGGGGAGGSTWGTNGSNGGNPYGGNFVAGADKYSQPTIQSGRGYAGGGAGGYGGYDDRTLIFVTNVYRHTNGANGASGVASFHFNFRN